MSFPFLREFDGKDVPGAAVMLIRSGEAIYAEACGMADLERRLPCTVKTNFRLASLTKAFTAMAVMILAERGRMGFDDRLGKYVGGLPAWSAEATIRQLLTHRSGVWDYEDLMPTDLTKQVKDADVAALLRGKAETYFASGTAFRYSNTGYALLALAVEAAAGISFAEFLRGEIFLPLGMNETVAFEEGISVVANRAMGYAVTEGSVEEADQSLTSSVLGDGGVYSSVNDLLKWDQALYGERLVSEAMLREAFRPWSKTTDFAGSGYGFGWYVSEARGTPSQWHYGSTCGFSTRIERYPEQKFTIILLANRRDVDFGEVARKIIDDL